MINFIKMDVYRFLKQKSIWILLIFTMAFTVLSMTMVKEDMDSMKKDISFLQNAQEFSDSIDEKYQPVDPEGKVIAGGSFGIMINTDVKWAEEGYKVSVWEFLMLHLNSKIYLLFIGFGLVFFTRAESKNGFIKTIGGILPSRGGLAFSKIFPALVYTAMSFAVVFTTIAVCSQLVFGYVNFAGFSSSIAPILVEFLLHFAFALVAVGFVILTNSSVGGTIFATFAISGLFEIFVTMINFFLVKFSLIGKDFVLLKHLILGNVGLVRIDSANSVLTHACIVSAVIMAIFMGFAIYTMKKRDVK